MAHDETEFDKLLKEAREWDARDRARHKSFGMQEGGAEPAFQAASRAPTVTLGELGRNATPNLEASREPPSNAPAAKPALAAKPAPALKLAIKTAVKQAQAQAAAQPRKSKAGWGWIVWLVVLYFVFKHFLR